MPKNKGFIIVLNNEGIQFLSDKLTKLLFFDGSYFVCDAIHQDAQFLVMEGVHQPPPERKTFRLDLQIPYSAVRYIVSGTDRDKALGFITQKET